MAHVVDPVSVKKVDAGVLRGFSIGIKSPRVVRDAKAANGRIIDGQIVEVSLVDRPANPNCQLVLAKSATGDDAVIQVEELYETTSDFVSNDLQSDITLQEENMKTAQEIIDSAKALAPAEIVKFDKATFDAARQALAQLITVEAKELGEGHDEQVSIAHLLQAVHHLFAWYEGEKAEGEVELTEDIELAAKKDDASKEPEVDKKKAEHEDDDMEKFMPKKGESKDSFMKRCKEAGKTDDFAKKCWDKYAKSVEIEIDEDEDETEKSADVSKCLECGCNQPGTDHGLTQTNDFANVAKPSHVTTAEMYTPDQTPKSAEPDDAEKKEEDEVSADEPKSVDVEAIVEEAIKSATQSIRTEIEALMSAKEAAEGRAMSLETELATAKSLIGAHEVDHNTMPKMRIGVIEAMNGRILEVMVAVPNSHSHYDWKTEMYVVPEEQKLSEAIALVMLMKGLEK